MQLLKSLWLNSCDFCKYQESGLHYCLLHSMEVKNMNAVRCEDWRSELEGSGWCISQSI